MHYYPEASHHEVAYSQHEIDVKYSDAITMADRIIMIKSVVKETANEYGYYATFMPKPVKGVNGNGMPYQEVLCQNIPHNRLALLLAHHSHPA